MSQILWHVGPQRYVPSICQPGFESASVSQEAMWLLRKRLRVSERLGSQGFQESVGILVLDLAQIISWTTLWKADSQV